MKNRDIEKNIKTMISSSKTHVWERVEKEVFPRETTSLETVTASGNGSITLKNNKAFIYSVCAIFLALIVMLSVFIPKLFKNSLDYSGSFYIDINPSVQVTVDKDGLVTEIVPLNEDALILLQGLSEYKGKSSEDVALAVWELAYELGYISPIKKDNAVLVTGSLKDDTLNDKLSSKIKKSLLLKIKEKGVYCAVLTDILNDAVKQQADEIGIAPSKYQLIKSAIDMGVKIDEMEYADISVSEINRRIKEFGNKLSEYGGMDYDGVLQHIKQYVDGQLEFIASALEDDINSVREYLIQMGDDQDNKTQKAQIKNDLNILDKLLEEINKPTTNGTYTKVLFDKLDSTIKSISQKDVLIALQFEMLNQIIETIIGKYADAVEQITTAKGEIKEKYNKFVVDNEQKIKEHLKQDGFDENYEHWLEEVYENFHDNWDKIKQDWQSERN